MLHVLLLHVLLLLLLLSQPLFPPLRSSHRFAPPPTPAYRFASAWSRVNDGSGTADSVLTSVESELDKEYLRVSSNASQVLDPDLRSNLFDNKALDGEDVQGEFELWKSRLETTPYDSWVPGAKFSLDKFLALQMLDFDVYQYNDMITRRGGVRDFDDRRLEALIKSTREELLPETKPRPKRDSGMTNKEVGDVILKFRGMAEVAGGWEGLEEGEREEFKAFTRNHLFGGIVPKIRGVKEEDVVMTAVRDVLGMEPVEVEVDETDETETEMIHEPTLKERVEDSHSEGYSVFHKAKLMEKEEVEEALREEGFPEKGERELHFERQKVYQDNLYRGQAIEAACRMWENGVWEVCGKVKRAGMESKTDEDRAEAFISDDGGMTAELGETFDKLKLGHDYKDVDMEGWIGSDYEKQDFEELLEESGEEMEDPLLKEGEFERKNWFEAADVDEGWRVEWRIIKELREKGIRFRDLLVEIDETGKGEVNEGKLKERLVEEGVEVGNEEIFMLKKWYEREDKEEEKE